MVLALQCFLEAREHGIEGERETGQFVSGRRDGQAPFRLGLGDRGRLPADPLDRSQGRARQQPARVRGHRQGERPADEQQEQQPVQCLRTVAQRCADDEDGGLFDLPRQTNGQGEQPGGVVDAHDMAAEEDRLGDGSCGARRQHGRRCDGRSRLDDVTLRREDLAERLVGVDESTARVQRSPFTLGQRADGGRGPCAQVEVDGAGQFGAHPGVEEGAQRGEHHRHRQTEGEGQAEPDGEPSQPSAHDPHRPCGRLSASSRRLGWYAVTAARRAGRSSVAGSPRTPPRRSSPRRR